MSSKRLQLEMNVTVMLITHDISVVAQLCDSVAVMYAGHDLSSGLRPCPSFAHPIIPTAWVLQNAFPNLVAPKEVLIAIDGYPPGPDRIRRPGADLP